MAAGLAAKAAVEVTVEEAVRIAVQEVASWDDVAAVNGPGVLAAEWEVTEMRQVVLEEGVLAK